MKTTPYFRKVALVGFVLSVCVSTVFAQTDSQSISSILEARKALATALADTAELPRPAFEVKTSGFQNVLASNGSIPSLNKATSNALPDLSVADAYIKFLKEQEKRYRYRLDLIQNDTIPDIFQIQLRSDIHRKLAMIKSVESLALLPKVTMVYQADAGGIQVLGFPVKSLLKNARYGLADSYRQGFARIKKDQVYGFVNLVGEEIIPAQYETAEPFNDGRALVKKIDWKFLNASGEESPALLNVADAHALNYGYSLVKFNATDKETEKYAVIDNSYDYTKKPVSALYDEILPFSSEELLLVRSGKKVGLIKINGTVRLGIDYEKIENANAPGIMRVVINTKMGLIDTLGNMKVSPIFDEIGDFAQNGLARARQGANWYLIRQQDMRMSKPLASINDFDASGLAIVKETSGLFGMMNKDLTMVKEAVFTSIGNFNEFGMAKACKAEKKCGVINATGREVIPMQFSEVQGFSKFGLVVVEEALDDCKTYGQKGPCTVQMVYDKRGNIVIPKAEGEAAKLNYAVRDTLYNGYILVKTFLSMKGPDEQVVKKTNYHLIEKNNLTRITPTYYESLKGVDTHFLFSVRKEGRWGLIDTTGKVVVTPQYKQIIYPAEGFYAVQGDNGKFGYIDRRGKQTVNFEFDRVMAFNGGIAIVSKGLNQVGIINKFSAKIVPCAFANIEYTEVDKLQVTSAAGDKFFINTKGDCVENCEKFEAIRQEANQKN